MQKLCCVRTRQHLCQFGLFRHNFTTVSPPILNHFWWELYHLRTLIHIHRPQTKPDATSLAKRALSTAMHATRCAASQSLNGLSPGTIAFRHDMFIDIPYIADILTISRSRQALIDSRLLKENTKRISHDYRIGETVMKKSILSLSDKLLPSFTGPYIIEQVHTNGTCTIRLTPNQTEHINIRRLKPYRA